MTLDLKALREQPHAMTCEATFSECAEAHCNCGKDERDALIDELAETRRERDLAADGFRGITDVIRANARAAAFEEAARAIDDAKYPSASAAIIRALAPLPPSVVCVQVETLRAAEKALACTHASLESRFRVDDDVPEVTGFFEVERLTRAALAALTKVTR